MIAEQVARRLPQAWLTARGVTPVLVGPVTDDDPHVDVVGATGRCGAGRPAPGPAGPSGNLMSSVGPLSPEVVEQIGAVLGDTTDGLTGGRPG
jgi:hypothetical protein